MTTPLKNAFLKPKPQLQFLVLKKKYVLKKKLLYIYSASTIRRGADNKI